MSIPSRRASAMGVAVCCRDCGTRVQGKQRALRIGAGLTVALGLSAAVLLVHRGVTQARAEAHARSLNQTLGVLAATVDEERCDVRANVELVTLLQGLGATADAQQRADEYCYQCARLGAQVPWSCADPGQ